MCTKDCCYYRLYISITIFLVYWAIGFFLRAVVFGWFPRKLGQSFKSILNIINEPLLAVANWINVACFTHFKELKSCKLVRVDGLLLKNTASFKVSTFPKISILILELPFHWKYLVSKLDRGGVFLPRVQKSQGGVNYIKHIF